MRNRSCKSDQILNFGGTLALFANRGKIWHKKNYGMLFYSIFHLDRCISEGRKPKI